jgi:hypothetical protein
MVIMPGTAHHRNTREAISHQVRLVVVLPGGLAWLDGTRALDGTRDLGCETGKQGHSPLLK